MNLLSGFEELPRFRTDQNPFSFTIVNALG